MNWGQTVANVLTAGLIAGGVTIVVLWLATLGRVKPGVAYFSRVGIALSSLLTIFFIGYGVVNRLYGERQSLWMDALTFGFGAMFLVGTIDSAIYKLTWTNTGFSVRRLVGPSFSANWPDVVAVIRIPGEYDSTYRIQLDHPKLKAFKVSSLVVGSKEFMSMLRRKTSSVV